MQIDIPAYSEEGKRSLDLFYIGSGNYFFFFEDSHAEAFYERLISRLFPSLKEFRVTCLHGKENIVRKAKQPRVFGLQYVFVVDKDFDDLIKNAWIQLENVFYLDRYSIENYLVDIRALARVLVEDFPLNGGEQYAMQQCSDYEQYLEKLIDRYLTITRYFVLAQKHRIAIANTKLDPDALLAGGNENHPMPTDEWLEKYAIEFRNKCAIRGETDWLTDNDALGNELTGAFAVADKPDGTLCCDIEVRHHIPGKHLLSCVVRYLGCRTNTEFAARFSSDKFIRVLNHVDLAALEPLRAAIANAHPAIAG